MSSTAKQFSGRVENNLLLLSLSMFFMLGWIYGGGSGNGEEAFCSPVSTACCSMITQLLAEQRDLSCCTAPSSIFPFLCTAEAHCSALCCIQPQPSLARRNESSPGAIQPQTHGYQPLYFLNVLLQVDTATCIHHFSPAKCNFPRSLKHAVSCTERLT